MGLQWAYDSDDDAIDGDELAADHQAADEALEAFDDQRTTWSAEQKAVSGVCVAVSQSKANQFAALAARVGAHGIGEPQFVEQRSDAVRSSRLRKRFRVRAAHAIAALTLRRIEREVRLMR